MFEKIKLFFIENYGMNSIIICVVIVLMLIIFRLIYIKTLKKDRVLALQASELREKTFVLRDQYHVKSWKNIVENSDTIILGVHGLQGQTDDFKNLSNLCRKQGWSLITYDRRGTGKNFDEFKFHSFETDINDLKDIIKAVKEKYPKQKIIVLGEAIGASIASYACKNNPDVNGLVVSNLITKNNLYPISIRFYFRLLIGFIFNSNIKIPIYLDPEEISSNSAYITNVKQRYSLKQIWTLKFLWQLKIINKKAPHIIRNLSQQTLILQSADDIFSDFHQLKILSKKWNQKQNYHFLFSGKHALINELEFNKIFEQIIVPWILKI